LISLFSLFIFFVPCAIIAFVFDMIDAFISEKASKQMSPRKKYKREIKARASSTLVLALMLLAVFGSHYDLPRLACVAWGFAVFSIVSPMAIFDLFDGAASVPRRLLRVAEFVLVGAFSVFYFSL
jgi:hypothetical protein